MKKYLGFLIVFGILIFGGIKVEATTSTDNNMGCLPSYRYSPINGQPCSSILPIPVTPPVVVSPTLDTTPRIMYWYGKVNQHIDTNGNWQTDPDGISGADLDKLTYCKKWFPETIRVEDYKLETINRWRNRGNVDGPFNSTKMSTKCIQSEVGVLPVIRDNPVISGISGPQFLDVNSMGTWKVKAYNSNGGNLSYKVDWGDVYNRCSYDSTSGPCMASEIQNPYGQSATFTHSYLKTGTYNPTFTVRNDNGGIATTSLSVLVGKTDSNPSITIISPNGGEVFKAGEEIKIKWDTENIQGDIAEINLNSIINWGGGVGVTLGKQFKNDGYEVITLPSVSDFISTNSPFGRYFTVEIVAVDNTGVMRRDSSDNLFTINSPNDINQPSNAPSIKVISPNGGEVYKDGQSINVDWFSSNISSNSSVNLILKGYNSNGDLIMNTLLSQNTILNDGSETVVLPKIPTYAGVKFGQYFKVEVNYNGSDTMDSSDNLFTIVDKNIQPSPITTYEDCAPGSIYNRTTGQRCLPIESNQNVCCEIFGYGAGMIKTPSTYEMISKNQCSVANGFTGGGRNIVDNSFCKTTISPAVILPTPNSILAKGTVGNEVKTVQSALTKQGYTLSADGKFGPKTEEAVKKFQAMKGLPVTGIIDDTIISLLLSYILES